MLNAFMNFNIFLYHFYIFPIISIHVPSFVHDFRCSFHDLFMFSLDVWPNLPLVRVAWNPGIFVSAPPTPFIASLSGAKRLQAILKMPSA